MGIRGKRKKKVYPKITTPEMEVALAKHFNIRTHIIVPNLSWGFFNHECDLFLIRKSGYGFEVEIKISKSDLKADFKKKHNHEDRQNRIIQLYYAVPINLLEACKEHVPTECGIITVERIDWNKGHRDFATVYREAGRRKGARRLTEKEQLKIARLGCMRIWNLKEKLNKIKKK